MKGKALVQALDIVNGQRQTMYGKPEDSFAVIASYWSTYLGKEITTKDVAALMMLMKAARITTGSGGIDSYVDAAAYAALGADMAYPDEIAVDVAEVLKKHCGA